MPRAPTCVALALVSTLAALGLMTGEASGTDRLPWSELAMPPSLGDDAAAVPTSLLVEQGRQLFEAKFTRPEGAGRPLATQAIVPTKRRRPAEQSHQRLAGPDASACAGCHNDPATGGAGEFVVNAFVSEGFTSADFDSLDPQFANERGTTHLFGAGLIELLAREMTRELQALRTGALARARAEGQAVTVRLVTKGVDFGRLSAEPDGVVDLAGLDGVDADLVIRPFGQKAVIPSLRHFTVNALNAHHGIQAVERFGPRWTGEDDFDGDGVASEIHAGDVTALVAFQATLPPPEQIEPDDTAWRVAASAGEAHFDAWGCAACHRPTLPLDELVFSEPGPDHLAGTLRAAEVADLLAIDLAALPWAAALQRDASGRWLIPLFSDLKRHRIADARTPRLGNELLAQRFVDRDTFRTAPLWGVASTAPYGHRADVSTLDEMVGAHGGAADHSRRAYQSGTAAERSALIAFLKTLQITCTACEPPF
ncbi:MAG: di-heme oxidoredictase family protein [Pseudomonadota bacterium]